jgi:TolA-binding protein
VQAEDRNRIEPAIQTLLTKFPPSETKALGLHNVANTIGWKLFVYANASPRGQDLLTLLDKCLVAIANYTQATGPGSDWAMWAERDLATAAIQSGDDTAAQAAMGRLTANYATRTDTPAALHFLGNYYLEVKKDNRAEAVYKYLVEKYPNHELAPLVKTGLGQIRLRQGDGQGAEATFQKVLTDYAGHPRLAEAVQLMGDGYYVQAQRERAAKREDKANDCCTEALEKWHMIMDRLPATPQQAARAHFFAAECYRYLGDTQKAIEYHQMVPKNWPTYEYAWLSYAKIYEILKLQIRRGLMSEEEGRASIRACLEGMCQGYPNCPMASNARAWLKDNANLVKGGQEK